MIQVDKLDGVAFKSDLGGSGAKHGFLKLVFILAI